MNTQLQTSDLVPLDLYKALGSWPRWPGRVVAAALGGEALLLQVGSHRLLPELCENVQDGFMKKQQGNEIKILKGSHVSAFRLLLCANSFKGFTVYLPTSAFLFVSPDDWLILVTSAMPGLEWQQT